MLQRTHRLARKSTLGLMYLAGRGNKRHIFLEPRITKLLQRGIGTSDSPYISDAVFRFGFQHFRDLSFGLNVSSACRKCLRHAGAFWHDDFTAAAEDHVPLSWVFGVPFRAPYRG